VFECLYCECKFTTSQEEYLDQHEEYQHSLCYYCDTDKHPLFDSTRRPSSINRQSSSVRQYWCCQTCEKEFVSKATFDQHTGLTILHVITVTRAAPHFTHRKPSTSITQTNILRQSGCCEREYQAWHLAHTRRLNTHLDSSVSTVTLNLLLTMLDGTMKMMNTTGRLNGSTVISSLPLMMLGCSTKTPNITSRAGTATGIYFARISPVPRADEHILAFQCSRCRLNFHTIHERDAHEKSHHSYSTVVSSFSAAQPQPVSSYSSSLSFSPQPIRSNLATYRIQRVTASVSCNLPV
jgi:hypothetical protein